MFEVLSKNEVVRELSLEVAEQLSSDNRKLRLKGRINASLLEMVENAPITTFEHIARTQNGVLNKGYIMESMVLDYKHLVQENDYCEVKYFGNDTPNILVNDDTRLIYIVVNKASLKGAFTIRNMKATRGSRLTLTYLIENDLLKPCKGLTEYLGLEF